MIGVVATFTAIWYYTSSKNAVATQHLVQNILSNNEDDISREQLMAVLTTYQLLAGFCIALPTYFMLQKFVIFRQTKEQKKTDKTELSEYSHLTEEFAQDKNKSVMTMLQDYISALDKRPFLLIGMFHSLGSLFTNLGFAYGSAIVVQIIKLLEPIETLILTVIYAQSFSSVTAKKSISMVVTITGTAILLSQKKKDASVNVFSVAFALLSGLSLSFRNVTVKHFQKEKAEKTALNGIRKFLEITAAGTIISCLQLLFAIRNLPRFSMMLINCEWYGFQAILFHGLYNLASIFVLSFISAPSHSLLNVGKRISNVLVASIAFGEKIGQEGILGLVIALIGGVTYSVDASKLPITKKSKGFFPVVLFLIGFFWISEFDTHISVISSIEESSHAEKMQMPPRERKVILLGPHDRYNFGDLLFGKVLAKLLENRAGYNKEDILFGGVVSTNMSIYGGEENIYSMKKLQQMSREDSEKGPYDIIYTGGEAMGCTHTCAVGMMPNQEMKDQAKQEKIYGCGYLVPKSHLVPDSEKDRPSNFAIINSMGGGISPQCAEAVNTADFGSYRDPKFPSYPDSAVMTKELYAEEIDIMADQVMDEIFPSTSERKYIAVQHKSQSLKPEQLAASLDVVSKETNATIVFFAAGVVPGHDSFDKYTEVAGLMEQPSIIYEGKNVWKVVALISRSEALISTSLHCRIMAFIFFRPRFTYCTGPKHKNFIENYDSKDSMGCMASATDIWPTLSDYYGSNPKITQEMTEETYNWAVRKYLRVFDSWSAILRKKYEEPLNLLN